MATTTCAAEKETVEATCQALSCVPFDVLSVHVPSAVGVPIVGRGIVRLICYNMIYYKSNSYDIIYYGIL